MILSKNQQVFFELLRAGLWENEAQLSRYKAIDYSAVLVIAEEQSMVGLVTAGLEHVSDVKVPQEDLLQFVGQTLQIEQQNKKLNVFVAKLIEKLRKENVYAILVKGQGIAQCYEKPLWRCSGDVDLLLSNDNYEVAKLLLTPLANTVEDEGVYSKHMGMNIESWIVELHGTLRCSLSKRIDKSLDRIQSDFFYGGNVRCWVNEGIPIFLPSADNDVVYVFTHILSHFFKGGIGLRQICDWCRLLYTYKDSLNHGLLESRIKKAGLMSEWKAFAALAVDYLGMPSETLPMYSSERRWKKKADRIISCILETGNFGQNRDTSYRDQHRYIIMKAISFWKNTKDSFRHFLIFPIDSIKIWFKRLQKGMSFVMKGK